jgi:pSer/pThr/pTyr-binding forkhead associated (FHA) protein
LPTQIEQIPDQTPEAVRAWLVATAGPTKGKTYPIPLDGATVGRLPEQPVYIPDERLSREHARIEFRGGQFIINDLGSRNGTALNGKLLSHPQALTSGDTIELGSSTLVITIEAPPKVG